MMRVKTRKGNNQIILEVEGRLAGAFVPELENCWRLASAVLPDAKISLDLKSVTCVDREGRHLLQAMHRDGVRFLRAGLAVQDIIDEVIEQPERGFGRYQ